MVVVGVLELGVLVGVELHGEVLGGGEGEGGGGVGFDEAQVLAGVADGSVFGGDGEGEAGAEGGRGGEVGLDGEDEGGFEGDGGGGGGGGREQAHRIVVGGAPRGGVGELEGEIVNVDARVAQCGDAAAAVGELVVLKAGVSD